MAGMRAARHDHHVRNACVHESLDRIVDHGPVEYRQQVFVRSISQRIETGSQTSREDNTLHLQTP